MRLPGCPAHHIERSRSMSPHKKGSITMNPDAYGPIGCGRSHGASSKQILDEARDLLGPAQDSGSVSAEYVRAVVELTARLIGLADNYADTPDVVTDLVTGWTS